VLEEARRLGFLGPGPVQTHLDHAAGFAEALRASFVTGDDRVPGRAADLGSGAGLPGLPLALYFAASRWTLVESAVRRAAFLRDAVRSLGLGARVDVAEERAEVLGRAVEHRGTYDLIVARSFGPPAVVAECGAPLLRLHGWLAVSEPPGGAPDRWPEAGLALLGLSRESAVSAGGWAYQVLGQRSLCSERYPRRVGVPTKRPLF